MRLFVAVWPSREAVEALAALPRPELPGIRWTTPDQWHVTLAFLGELDGGGSAAAAEALGSAAASLTPVAVRLGPSTVRLGRALLCAPAGGLEGWAHAVRGALGPGLGRGGAGSAGPGASGVGPSGEDHPFRGHCTLARARRGQTVPAPLAGVPLAAGWTARTLCLVRSTLDRRGARYETVVSATVPS